MSIEKAKAFLDKVRDDHKLRESLRPSTQHAWDGVLHVAKQHGYDCTLSDLHNALREKFNMHDVPAARNDDEANCILIAPKT